MESPAHIMERVAGLDHKGVIVVDGSGNPVPGRTTQNIDAQLSAKAEQSHPTGLSEQQSASATAGIVNAAMSATGAIKSMLGSNEASSTAAAGRAASAMAPVISSVYGYPLQTTHSLKSGPFIAASDSHLFEKQQTFNRSKIVERAVHACGSGGFGYFEVTADVTPYTKAAFLNKVGKRTPIAARFSTVTFGREFPDSARNPRGLAFKFYTEEGNYDCLTINWPVFFVRDPMMGPDNIKSHQRNPMNFQVNWDSIFDWESLVPESMLTNLHFWSDHGTPVGWRFMNGYPVHTFKWVNAANEHVYVRYVFKCEQGIKNFNDDEAVKMCGEDPDFAKRDLWAHIDGGGEAVWKVCVQMLKEGDQTKCSFDPFDPTKYWPEEQFPAMEFGRMVVNRNPENYHRDIEQVAFSPGSLVPGIEPSPDPLLQFRMFLYRDAQYYRLGVNLHQIPVNCPFMTKNYHPWARDGVMRVDTNGGAEASYYPNSFHNPPMPQPDLEAIWKAHPITAKASELFLARQGTRDEGTDNEYVQCRHFLTKILSPHEVANTIHNISKYMMRVTRDDVKLRFLIACYKIDPKFASQIIDAMVNKYAFKSFDFNRVEKNALKMPHTVDQSKGYVPYPLV